MAGIYNFVPEDAERFATKIGTKTRRRGNELSFMWCPYCQGGGKDKNTFSINLETGLFKCLRASCSIQGNMITLARDFGFSLGSDVDTYYHLKWQRFKTFTKKPESIEIRDAAVEYMASRGISQAVTEQYHITTLKDNDNILMFPFYDAENQLQFIKYRNTTYQKGQSGSKEWCEADCRPILFGMDQCRPDENKTLIMTEGQIDSLSVAEAGYQNAVSVPTGKNGFTWIPHCWDWLQQFEKLIVFGDFEHGAMTLLPDMKARFNGQVWHVRPEDYQDCKDANEILQKYGKDGIKACIENAEQEADIHLIRMADVTPADLAGMPHISTGFTQLDRLLGGFYYGQVILVSGRRGKGKSTLASQFMCQALHADQNCLAYSGELIHSNFREWMDRQLAGPEHLKRISNDTGKVDWTLQEWQRTRLHDWYYNHMWLYDESGITDEETESILQTVEKAVREYGIRVVLIDNLMTALEENLSADLNRLQSNFVRQLARIARKYNVIIFLIAHPRKRKGDGGDFDADDVMGSGNITNAVDVVLNYDTGPDKFGKPDRILAVKKNRLTGDLDDGIGLWYDPASKRISERKDDFSWPTDLKIKQMEVVHDVELPWRDDS